MIVITVIVPFHNSARSVRRCVEALLAQRFPADRYEILAIDNNSSDASSDIVRSYAGIRVLSEAKQGSYAARNRGLREARGAIVAFTDADCVPSTEWLHEIETAMQAPEVGIALGSHTFASDRPPLSMLADYENEKKAYVFRSEKKALYYGHTNNMAVRKTLFEQQGTFLETSRGADTLFVRQCVEQLSVRIAYYSEAMQVRHLEIDSVARYMRKVSTYGGSSRKFRHHGFARPLGNRERLAVYARTIRHRRYSPSESAELFGLLAFGLACWSVGSLTTRVESALVGSRRSSPRSIEQP